MDKFQRVSEGIDGCQRHYRGSQYQILFFLSLCAPPSSINLFSAWYGSTDGCWNFGANITSVAQQLPLKTATNFRVVLRRGDADEQSQQ
jgi:hypothetical protein